MEKFFTEWERIEFLILKASQKTKPTQRSTVITLLSEAIEGIHQLPEPSPKLYWLITIAKTYQDLNLKELSIAVFEQALQALEHCEDDYERAMDFNEIGYQYVKLERSEGFKLPETAFKIATSLEDIDGRDLVLCDIARNYGYLEQIETALEIARLVQDQHRVIFYVLEPLQIELTDFFS